MSFYVDSTPALTLPRRQRVVQALAGLAADAVTTSILAVLAVLAQPRIDPLLAAVFWRRAVLNAIAIVLNALPVLEVDGHLGASPTYLDEPGSGAPRPEAALFADPAATGGQATGEDSAWPLTAPSASSPDSP